MKSAVNERLLRFIRQEVGSTRELASKLGISEVTLGNKIRGDRKLDIEVLVSILQEYPQLSADWLLLGKGEMFRSETIQASSHIDDNEQQKIDILEKELKEEKERSYKYWNTIQKLIQ